MGSSTAKNTAAVVLCNVGGRLDLSPFCNQDALRAQAGGGGGLPGGGFACGVPPVYELVAVSHHSGSLEGGHYTASGRAAADECSWFGFNDSQLHAELPPTGSASSSAYVLMFRLAGVA